jgi:hypothetical protein
MPEGASQRIDRAAASRGAVALQKSKADDARRGRLSRWFSDGQAKARIVAPPGAAGGQPMTAPEPGWVKLERGIRACVEGSSQARPTRSVLLISSRS